MQEIFVGVDVAKDWLDIHHPGRGARRIENTPKAVRTFARSSARQGDWIIFEASGGYDRLLREALEVAAVRFTRVNPRQARDFARAMGVIGKTGRVDARMLSELGAILGGGRCRVALIGGVDHALRHARIHRPSRCQRRLETGPLGRLKTDPPLDEQAATRGALR